MLSQKTRYAIRAMQHLADRYGEGPVQLAEIAAVQKVTETEAVKEIEAALAKGPRRGPKPAEEASTDEATEEEAA